MILDVNLRAPMLLTRALLPSMLARRSGVILNITGMCVMYPHPHALPCAVADPALLASSV